MRDQRGVFGQAVGKLVFVDVIGVETERRSACACSVLFSGVAELALKRLCDRDRAREDDARIARHIVEHRIESIEVSRKQCVRNQCPRTAVELHADLPSFERRHVHFVAELAHGGLGPRNRVDRVRYLTCRAELHGADLVRRLLILRVEVAYPGDLVVIELDSARKTPVRCEDVDQCAARRKGASVLDQRDPLVPAGQKLLDQLVSFDSLTDLERQQPFRDVRSRRDAPKKAGCGNDQHTPRGVLGQTGEGGHALHFGTTIGHDLEQWTRICGGEHQHVAVRVPEQEPQVRLVSIRLVEVRGDDYQALFVARGDGLRKRPIERAVRKCADVDPRSTGERFDQLTNRGICILQRRLKRHRVACASPAECAGPTKVASPRCWP